jgi:hypothetical protein
MIHGALRNGTKHWGAPRYGTVRGLNTYKTMSKTISEKTPDSVDVALEKLYRVVEGHFNSLSPEEKKKKLEIIGEVHSQLSAQGSRKRSKRQSTVRPQGLCQASRSGTP